MPSTRPSRQQLQLSASTSDPINWAEFSNAQIHEDDFTHPPFRHRDLPSPPSLYHRSGSFDSTNGAPKWTCPNGSSFHPLMRVSPASTTYCTRGYTAVYEKIDDDDDDYDDNRMTCNHILRSFRAGERTGNILPSNHNGVPFIPDSSQFNAARRAMRENETEFNGENVHVSILPRYVSVENGRDNNIVSASVHGFQDVNMNSRRPTLNGHQHCFRDRDCNTFHATNAFGHSGSNSCNQLCAACVVNVSDSSRCLVDSNTSRQSEGNSNSNSSPNTPPFQNTMAPNCASNLYNISTYPYPPPHPLPNTVAYPQIPSLPNSNHCTNSNFDCANLEGNDNPPPYTEQGCDIRPRNTNKPEVPIRGSNLYQNRAGGGTPFTDLTRTHSSRDNRQALVHGNNYFAGTVVAGCSPCRECCSSCPPIPPISQGRNPNDIQTQLTHSCASDASNRGQHTVNNLSRQNLRQSQPQQDGRPISFSGTLPRHRTHNEQDSEEENDRCFAIRDGGNDLSLESSRTLENGVRGQIEQSEQASRVDNQNYTNSEDEMSEQIIVTSLRNYCYDKQSTA